MCAKKRIEDYAKEKHLVLVLIAVLIWSAIDAHDYFAWTMLTIPSVIYAGTLIATHKKFRFTYFTYVLVFIHIVILLIGAKYTYTHNPLFEEVKEIFNISRNHYDRVGHLAQGFVPAIVAREFLLRKGYFKKSKFFYVTIFAFVLAISAAWELLEFFAVVISNLPAKYVLSLQGDYLDTQKDMLLAFVGAALALVSLGKTHDKRMEDISEE
jgi:putative membrane protein